MAGGFESKVISLGYFFQMRDQPLVIPGLQRNFEWGQKEVKLLWRDIGFHSKTKNLDEMFFEGIIEGAISYEVIGGHGFGYDPVFFLPELDCTSAQLSEEEKNRKSHRGQALQEILKHLLSLE